MTTARSDLDAVRLDLPVAGYYRTKLVKGGPFVPVRIYFGQPVIDGELQDRSPCWCVEVDGQTDKWEMDKETGYRCRVRRDVEEVWPHCAREPITRQRYEWMVKHAAWAKENAPDHPKASPREAIDWNTLPPRF